MSKAKNIWNSIVESNYVSRIFRWGLPLIYTLSMGVGCQDQDKVIDIFSEPSGDRYLVYRVERKGDKFDVSVEERERISLERALNRIGEEDREKIDSFLVNLDKDYIEGYKDAEKMNREISFSGEGKDTLKLGEIVPYRNCRLNKNGSWIVDFSEEISPKGIKFDAKYILEDRVPFFVDDNLNQGYWIEIDGNLGILNIDVRTYDLGDNIPQGSNVNL